MPPSLQVPCVRCGRSVTVAAARPLPTCASCAGGTATWEVRVGAERLRLDLAEVRARLVAGTLDGTDVVVSEGGTVTAVAAHPAFRAFFLPGHPDALPPRTATGAAAGASRSPGSARRVSMLVG